MSLNTRYFFLTNICIVVLYSCRHTTSETQLVGCLPEPPVKIVTDTVSQRIYWLSFIGEIYGMSLGSDQPERIVQGIGTNRSVTFVEDFYVDQTRQQLLFTDLWDRATNQAAVKQMSLADRKITTLVVFKQEIPYRLWIDPVTKAVYYLTKSKSMREHMYRLRRLREDRPVAVSSRRIEDVEEWVSAHQKNQSLLSQTKQLADN